VITGPLVNCHAIPYGGIIGKLLARRIHDKQLTYHFVVVVVVVVVRDVGRDGYN